MRKFLTAALLASVASTAFAADLPSRKAPPPSPVYAPPPPFSWTGFYVGVNGGYGFGSLSNFGGTEFGDPQGGFVGGTAGYNYQFGQFVTGIEGTLDWADISTGSTFGDGSTSSYKVDTLANVLGRFGLAFDRALFYVAAGYAGADVKANFFDTNTGLPSSNSGWQNGWAVGGGFEYAFTNNISAKVEYTFSKFADKTYFAGTPDAISTGLTLNSIKSGINYRF